MKIYNCNDPEFIERMAAVRDERYTDFRRDLLRAELNESSNNKSLGYEVLKELDKKPEVETENLLNAYIEFREKARLDFDNVKQIIRNRYYINSVCVKDADVKIAIDESICSILRSEVPYYKDITADQIIQLINHYLIICIDKEMEDALNREMSNNLESGLRNFGEYLSSNDSALQAMVDIVYEHIPTAMRSEGISKVESVEEYLRLTN